MTRSIYRAVGVGVAALAAIAGPLTATAAEPTASVAACDTPTLSIQVMTRPVTGAITPDGTRMYVATGTYGGRVQVLDLSSNTIVDTITVGDFPEGIAMATTSTGTYAYVANGANTNKSVSVIDIATDKVVTTINVGRNVRNIAVAPDGSRAYVTNTNDDTVTVIDTETQALDQSSPFIAAGAEPWGITMSADGASIYVANRAGKSVSVINAATGSIVKTFALERPRSRGSRGR